MEDLMKRLFNIEQSIVIILGIKSPSHVARLQYERLVRERQDILNKLGYYNPTLSELENANNLNNFLKNNG